MDILPCAATFNISIHNDLPSEAKWQLGWVFIGFEVISLAGNLSITIIASLVDIWVQTKTKWNDHKAEKIVSKRMENRKILCKKAPRVFQYF